MLQLSKIFLTFIALFMPCFVMFASSSSLEKSNILCCTQDHYPSIGQVPILSVPTTSKSLPSKSDELESGIASFKGWYVGVNAGYAKGSSDVTTTISESDTPYLFPPDIAQIEPLANGTINTSGFTGGMEGGYNWQYKNWLAGLEIDFDYLGLNNTREQTQAYDSSPDYSFTLSQSIQTQWLATVRPRLGFVVKRFLIYLTGGMAFTQLESKNGFSDNYIDGTSHLPSKAFESAQANKIQYGWSAGFGVEFFLTKQWSLKGEYLRANLPSILSSSSLTVSPSYPYYVKNPFSHSANLTADVVRFGVNYHF